MQAAACATVNAQSLCRLEARTTIQAKYFVVARAGIALADFQKLMQYEGILGFLLLLKDY